MDNENEIDNQIMIDKIMDEIRRKNPNCYAYFESNIQPELEILQPKQYDFELQNMNEKLLNSFFYDIIKILWQKTEQKKMITIVFLLFCDMDQLEEIKGGGGSGGSGGGTSFYFSLIFALLFLTNHVIFSYKIQRFHNEPPRRVKQLRAPNYYEDITDTTDTVIDIPNQPFDITHVTQQYNQQQLLNLLENMKTIVSSSKFVNLLLDVAKSKTKKSFAKSIFFVKLLRKLDSAFKSADPSKDMHKRVINGLKIFDVDVNKLIRESGITISLGFADTIGFSDFLSEIISTGLLPELKLVFYIAPILMESLMDNSLSLEIEPKSFIQLISQGGTKSRRKKGKKTRKKRTLK
jgi:hypothetical protein